MTLASWITVMSAVASELMSVDRSGKDVAVRSDTHYNAENQDPG